MSVPAAVERWRPLVAETLDQHWPGLEDGEAWILAQMWQESAGDPSAVSNAGAAGLMQLMPATALEVGVADRFEADQSIAGGVVYLKRQYDRLPVDVALRSAFPHVSRLLCALASYNGGRGYVNVAQRRARSEGDLEWWTWGAVSRELERVVLRGKRPDVKQIRDYVARISAKWTLARGVAPAAAALREE